MPQHRGYIHGIMRKVRIYQTRAVRASGSVNVHRTMRKIRMFRMTGWQTRANGSLNIHRIDQAEDTDVSNHETADVSEQLSEY